MKINGDFTLIVYLTTLIINSALLLLIIIKQRKNLKNPVYLSFILSVFFLLLWTIFNYLADTTSNYAQALFYTRATIPSGLMMFWFVFIFSYLFPEKTSNQRTVSLIYLASIATFSVLAMTKAVIRNVTIDPAIGISNVDNSILFMPIMILLVAIFGHAIYNLFKKYSSLKGVFKEQVRYTLIGWGLFLVGVIVVSALLPLLTGNATLSKLGPFFSIFMVGLTTYAILRHQFLDIRIIIQRGLIYLVLLGIIAVIYISGLQVLGYFFSKVADINSVISAGITMVLGIFFFRPLENYFQRITDPIFFKGKYNYADALHRLSKILNTNLSQTDIVAASSLALKEIFKTAEVVFNFSDVREQISTKILRDGQASVPIIFESQQIGAIELGPKLSGDTYNSGDVQLLQTFAYQAAVAIEKGKLYEKVQKYSTELEQRVSERTAEIKKLQEEQKQIMIDISHNLQTPLTVIKGELEALAIPLADQDKIAAVEKSLMRVSDFIRQLLHLARLEGSSYDADFSSLDLSALAREQIEYFEVMAKENKVDIISNISPRIQIFGNKQLLAEMLTNLVSNAIKYRNIKVKSVVTILLKETGQSIQLSVRDNGIGIAPEDIPKIFTCFYRASSDAHLPAGAGLGLAIAERIVLKHQGTMSVSSALGKGTEFRITFPSVKA
ncbi:hypothetical protein A3A09_00380 [Candidatus Nomurabacteria bacterium RIFCSPLOWO2_01_FULL_42_20]|nr:MAG: hypothetical protein A3A09_00380 [Candidatus Nomurabacteria bacterium RIFCSPLOWO2_01_FULL_42_20]